VVEYVRNGWAADLTTYIERSPDFKVEEFLPPVRDIGTVDGMEVGFPNGTATNMYYFNQDLFVESGLETPLELYQRDAWTWDAFREAARRNMRYDSSGNPITWGASVHLGDTLSRGWIWSNGGLEVDDVKNPTVALWDRPEAVEALDFMQRMIHDDEVAIREGSTTNGFLNGTLAMYARWNSAFPLHAQAPFEWGIVPYPKGPSAQGRYAADLTAALAAMSPSTKHPEEAWKWIAFISSYEGNVFRLEASGGIPSRAAFTEREIAMYQPDNLINPEMLFLPLQIGQSRIMAPNQGDIWRAAYAELAKIFNNEVPASIGAASAAAMANAVIAGGAVD